MTITTNPPWPEIVAHPNLPVSEYISEHQITWEIIARQERARAEAAMARLRVAVEALDDIRVDDGDSPRTRAMLALASIGPLPPLPKEAV